MYALRVYNVLLPALIFAFDFQWITEGRLGEDITQLYKDLSSYRGGGLSAFEGFRLLTFLFLATVTDDDTHCDTSDDTHSDTSDDTNSDTSYEIEESCSFCEDLAEKLRSDEIATLWSIIKKLARLLRFVAQQDEEEEELVFLQADLVNEMHRACAGLMSALSDTPKHEPTSIRENLRGKPQSDKFTRWAEYVSFRHPSVACILS